jgi:hypothetical protein
VKPGTSIVTVVDRSIVRLVADVPEDDFAAVVPGALAKIHVVPTKDDFVKPITRRAPAADPVTRTVHVEIDIDDAQKHLPVYTTAEIGLDVGEPTPALELPLAAVSIRGTKATLFTVKGDKAHLISVLMKGEAGGSVFLETDATLDPSTPVVLQGRTLLSEGDAVSLSHPDGGPRTADARPEKGVP